MMSATPKIENWPVQYVSYRVHKIKNLMSLAIFFPQKNSKNLSENLTIAPLQRFSCCKKGQVLKILRGNKILTSIKGHNSVLNKPKMTGTNHNIDLVNINAYKKFGEILFIYSPGLSRNKILTWIWGQDWSTEDYWVGMWHYTSLPMAMWNLARAQNIPIARPSA